MNLLDKTSIKIDGVVDFDWAPSTPQREGIKTYEQLICFWTPEIGSNPAKVGLMSIPSKEVVRSLNLFSVSDAKLHWQSESAYLCVKVDRHSKSKKSQATTLEIFRVKEKGVPVEVVDTIKDTVINFAWEPKGDRFAIITTTEPTGATAVAPKTAVAFFCPEKAKGPVAGNFKHLRTLEKKNSNAIYWAPRGRFVVIATVHNQQNSDLDFFDLDFEGEKPESDKDLTANLQLMNTADHYGVTDVEWDPSGRFVATWASVWKHSVCSYNPPHHQIAGQITNVYRWKMATTFTTSRARPSERNPLKNSSNLRGGQGPRRCLPRMSRSRSARTFASTVACLIKRMRIAALLPIWP
jgi:translation initiation factor 3 subunit B